MLDNLRNAIRGAMSPLGHSGMGDETTWKLLKELWDKADNKAEYCKKQWGYWEGELINKLVMMGYFPDQVKSNANVIKPIVETIVKNVLDAPFTVAVVPDLNSFYDIDAIKNARAIADVFNDELQNIFRNNDIESIQEQIGRAGNICGFSPSLTEWTTKNRPDGEIKISYKESQNLRWNKNATHNNISMIGFAECLSVSEAKDLYARDQNGAFDEDLCNKIEEIAETSIGKGYRKRTGGILNYVNTDTNTAGRAYVTDGGTGGIQAGKEVKLVNMWLHDDSVYAPEKKDDNKTEEKKEEFIRAYPNGRHIVFSVNEQKKLILLDEPLPPSFKNLGNIDVFNPTYFKDLSGKSSIDDLTSIQDRINALCAKYREKIQNDIDLTLVDEDFGMKDNSIVRSGIVRIKNYIDTRKPISEPMSNQSIEKAMQLLEAIEKLIAFAYQEARINETMLYGAQQKGTTSGEQVEMLQESPMADIRAQQRNFKNWLVNVAEKCLLFIQYNYTSQRLIQLSTGIDGANIAKIDTIDGKRTITLYKEANGAIQQIKQLDMATDLKFKIECTGGTSIPRSRKESEAVIDNLMANEAIVALIQQQNFDLLEIILDIKDIPNRRAIMTLLRRQGEQRTKAEAERKITMKDLVSNPEMMKASAQFIEALQKAGRPQAIAQCLEMIGLSGKAGDLTDTPIQDVSSKADLKDVVATTEGKISADPRKDLKGREIAGAVIDLEKGGQNGFKTGAEVGAGKQSA